MVGLASFARGTEAAATREKHGMLRRLISRFVPGGVPDETETELTDVAQALAPYRDEPVAPLLRLADPVRD